ncbi:MAG: hypothetical protein ACM3WS_02515, partial [Bacillota bacterium]
MITNPLSSFRKNTLGAAVAAALLVACGGGGGTATAPAGGTLSGTVAVGAPMVNATVTVKDAAGVTKTASAAADGSYGGISMDGMTAPFRVQACGLVDGNYSCFYSVVRQAGTANVTPLTNATVALALGSDPGALFDATAPAAAPSAAALDSQKQKIKSALGDLPAKAGLGDFDFATTAFAADRTGMDKMLDAVKISTGMDGSTGKVFVQIEGKIGDGNAYFDQDGGSGTLSAGSGMDVDLKGISRIFVDGLSYAISAPDQATCASRMSAANIFDNAFSLNIGDGVPALTKSTAPAMICQFTDMIHLLGGRVANPVLKDCDFTTDTSNKTCVVGFNIVKGDISFDGAELAVVLRSGADWKLLGRESPYEIHVGAAAQRTVRLDRSDVPPQYTRALSFDISGSDGISAIAVRAAKVYQRNLANTGWEATPLVTLSLSDACITAQSGTTKHLNIDGSSCGASWLSLGDSGANPAEAAAGDALIDNFYKRGRKVKIELYSDLAATARLATIIKRIDGVPPKFAALASFPWLELDAASKSALVAYNGTANTFQVGWNRNPVVSAKDISFCLGPDCSGSNRAAHEDVAVGATSRILTLSGSVPAGASAYKQISLY